MQNASSKQQTKQKHKPSHQQAGLPPHSALPIRGKTNKQGKTQHQSDFVLTQTYWTNLRRAETKRKKEFNLEAWEKETSNTINFKEK